VSGSVMYVASNFPVGKVYPGRFHIILFGVYVLVEPRSVIWFLGLLKHGGSAPVLLDKEISDKQLAKWARVVCIEYCGSGMMDGHAPLRLHVDPKGVARYSSAYNNAVGSVAHLFIRPLY
jgi:hypothetical protein